MYLLADIAAPMAMPTMLPATKPIEMRRKLTSRCSGRVRLSAGYSFTRWLTNTLKTAEGAGRIATSWMANRATSSHRISVPTTELTLTIVWIRRSLLSAALNTASSRVVSSRFGSAEEIAPAAAWPFAPALDMGAASRQHCAHGPARRDLLLGVDGIGRSRTRNIDGHDRRDPSRPG